VACTTSFSDVAKGSDGEGQKLNEGAVNSGLPSQTSLTRGKEGNASQRSQRFFKEKKRSAHIMIGFSLLKKKALLGPTSQE